MRSIFLSHCKHFLRANIDIKHLRHCCTLYSASFKFGIIRNLEPCSPLEKKCALAYFNYTFVREKIMRTHYFIFKKSSNVPRKITSQT